MIAYSEDQARAFVTDAGTWQRGQPLAQPANWANVGRTDATAWGECAGSGAKPYLTGIDLREPAFKCSCPSRVFPCKHGAGLLLLLARQPGLFTGSTEPIWLEEWLVKRQQTQEKKVDKAGPGPPAPASELAAAAGDPDLAAPPPPAAAEPGGEATPARLGRMAQGADELETWLLDLVRNGLATLDQQPATFWERQAARLVDNQLPGLAATVRELAALRHAHADWPARLLGRLGEAYWLMRAFQNRAQLPAATQQEVLQQVGITLKKEALPAHAAPVADEWRVLGQFTWEEDRLTARRSWLRGQHTGHPALVLEFAFGRQPFATPLVPHGCYAGGLLFYPGPLPLRAAPAALAYAGSAPRGAAPPAQRPSQLLDEYATALAGQPWLREWPATLAPVVPTRQPDGTWLLQHPAETGGLPLRFASAEAPWELLAQSGGHPVALFGEWDGRAFRPLNSWPWGSETELEAGTGAAAAPGGPAPNAPVPAPDAAVSPAGESAAGAGYPAFSQLLRIGLLGTRQSGEALPPLPGLAAAADGPEQRLLLGAGALALMQKAGFRPPAAAAAPPAPALAEAWQPLGPLGTECFRALLAGSRFVAFRTDYWAQMEQHQRLVPPGLLVAALNNADFRLHLPGTMSALLGERGQWLARQNPDWHAVLAPRHASRDPATWETGDLHARRFFIQLLHQDDPEQARQLLAAALPAEPAAAQAALLGELEHTVTAADAPLLLSYLTAKSKEVRQTVVPLLVRLPGSALVERLWQRALPLLALKRPLLGRTKLLVELPAAWDKAWQADGIEQKTSGFEGGERAGWLGQLLALLPPSRWAAHFQVSAEELLALAEATDWGPLLLRAWARAAYLHQDKPFAAPLLLRHFAQPGLLLHRQATHLTWLLSDAEKIALLRTLLPPRTGEVPAFLPEFLKYIFVPWPADIVQAVLRSVVHGLAPAVTNPYGEPHQRLFSLLNSLASYVPDDQLPACAEVLGPLADAHPPVAQLVEQFFESVRFRQQLAASLTEPPTPPLS